MAQTTRHIAAEELDALEPDDPRAQRSRRDLRRIHRAMGSLAILRDAIRRTLGDDPPRTILELGAGDGSLCLRLAHAFRHRWKGVQLTLLDRHNAISASTLAAFAALDWTVTTLFMDVDEWARQPQTTEHYDLCCTTLFLHHFDSDQLQGLFARVATVADTFVACEPRRSLAAWIGSHLVGCIGANSVTREDAVKSVAAGFTDTDIGALWPDTAVGWRIDESAARLFTHLFVATRQRTATGLT